MKLAQYSIFIHLAGSKTVKTVALLSAVAVLMLGGCTNMLINKHGYVSPDADNIREDGRPLFIPHNAPSISQGYDTESSKKLGGTTALIHEGLDIIGKKGTPVLAVAPGIVIVSYYMPLSGNRVMIEHGRNEKGESIMSRYLHLEKRIVKKGDRVVRGQQIGTLGSTGLLADYPHLHYEIRTGERPDEFISTPMNPHRFWADGAGIITCFDSERRWEDKPFNTTYPVPCL